MHLLESICSWIFSRLQPDHCNHKCAHIVLTANPFRNSLGTSTFNSQPYGLSESRHECCHTSRHLQRCEVLFSSHYIRRLHLPGQPHATPLVAQAQVAQ